MIILSWYYPIKLTGDVLIVINLIREPKIYLFANNFSTSYLHFSNTFNALSCVSRIFSNMPLTVQLKIDIFVIDISCEFLKNISKYIFIYLFNGKTYQIIKSIDWFYLIFFLCMTQWIFLKNMYTWFNSSFFLSFSFFLFRFSFCVSRYIFDFDFSICLSNLSI